MVSKRLLSIALFGHLLLDPVYADDEADDSPDSEEPEAAAADAEDDEDDNDPDLAPEPEAEGGDKDAPTDPAMQAQLDKLKELTEKMKELGDSDDPEKKAEMDKLMASLKEMGLGGQPQPGAGLPPQSMTGKCVKFATRSAELDVAKASLELMKNAESAADLKKDGLTQLVATCSILLKSAGDSMKKMPKWIVSKHNKLDDSMKESQVDDVELEVVKEIADELLEDWDEEIEEREKEKEAKSKPKKAYTPPGGAAPAPQFSFFTVVLCIGFIGTVFGMVIMYLLNHLASAPAGPKQKQRTAQEKKDDRMERKRASKVKGN